MTGLPASYGPVPDALSVKLSSPAECTAHTPGSGAPPIRHTDQTSCNDGSAQNTAPPPGVLRSAMLSSSLMKTAPSGVVPSITYCPLHSCGGLAAKSAPSGG